MVAFDNLLLKKMMMIMMMRMVLMLKKPGLGYMQFTQNDDLYSVGHS